MAALMDSPRWILKKICRLGETQLKVGICWTSAISDKPIYTSVVRKLHIVSSWLR
jgi:hypothetical protein